MTSDIAFLKNVTGFTDVPFYPSAVPVMQVPTVMGPFYEREDIADDSRLTMPLCAYDAPVKTRFKALLTIRLHPNWDSA